MSISTKVRDDLPESDFGEPEGRKFPIHDQEDLDSAAHLIGKANDPEATKRRIVAIAKRKGLKLPDAWQEDHMSKFAMVQKKGIVFRFGDHVDGNGKKYSLTREQFDAANPPGTTVPVGFDPVGKEHYDPATNDFEGKYGNVVVSSSATHVLGNYSIVPMLDEVIREKGRKVSAVFGRKKHELRRVDVTDRPVLPDAAFFAEGDEEVTITAEFALNPEEMAKVEQIPTPNDGNGPLHDNPSALRAGMQHIHDITMSAYPGLCGPLMQFAASEGPKKHMAMIHNATKTHGAACSGSSCFALKGEPPVADEIVADPNATAQDKRIADLEAKLLKERNKRIDTEAVSFAQTFSDRILPAARPFFVGLYQALATDDDEGETVQFAQGETVVNYTRVQLLTKAVQEIIPHGVGTARTTAGDVKKPLKVPADAAVFGLTHHTNDDTPPADPTKPTPPGEQPTEERLAVLLKSWTDAPLRGGNSLNAN